MNLLKIICLVITSVLIFSCSGRTINIEKDIDFFIDMGWQKLSNYKFEIDNKGSYESGNDSNIYLKATRNDTNVVFEYYKSKDALYPVDFLKTYADENSSMYHVVSLRKNDTVYYYTTSAKEEEIFTNFELMDLKVGKHPALRRVIE